MGTLLVCLVIALCAALVVRGMIRNKKAGKSSCGCGCEGCAAKGACHPRT